MSTQLAYANTNKGSNFSIQKISTDTFQIADHNSLSIENELGNIEITGWSNDFMVVEFDITVQKDSQSDAEELYDRIKTKVNDYTRYFNINIEIEEKSQGFFSKMMTDLNIDNEKSDVDINMKISIPKTMDLDIKNEFGDVVLLDWEGNLECELKHGDLIVTSDIKSIKLKQNYGKANFSNIEKARVEIKNAELEAATINDFELDSHGSDINVQHIGYLYLDSNKDELDLKHIDKVKGEMKFGTLIIEELKTEVILEMKVSDLRITKIQDNAPNIFLKQDNSEIDLNIKDLSYKLSAEMEEGIFRIPESCTDIKSNVIDEKNQHRIITGSHNYTGTGNITIEGKKGFVLLREL